MMPETKLLPCPFCGSHKVKVDSKSVRAGYNGIGDIVYRATYSARCNRCHARGGAVGGKVLSLENYPREIKYPLPEWATTWYELKSKAVEAWNKRADTKDEAWQCQGNIGG